MGARYESFYLRRSRKRSIRLHKQETGSRRVQKETKSTVTHSAGQYRPNAVRRQKVEFQKAGHNEESNQVSIRYGTRHEQMAIQKPGTQKSNRLSKGEASPIHQDVRNTSASGRISEGPSVKKVSNNRYAAISSGKANVSNNVASPGRRRVNSRHTEKRAVTTSGHSRRVNVLKSAGKRVAKFSGRVITKTARVSFRVAKKTVKEFSKRVVKDTTKAAQTGDPNSNFVNVGTQELKKTIFGSLKLGKRTIQGAHRAAVIIKKTVKTIERAVKAFIRLIKALISLVSKSIAFFTTVGWFLVPVILIASAAFIIFSGARNASDSSWREVTAYYDETDENENEIESVLNALDQELQQKIDQIKSEANIGDVKIRGNAASRKEILLIYSIIQGVTLEEDDICEMTEQNKEQLRNVFWLFNSVESNVSYHTETQMVETEREIIHEPEEGDEDAEPVKEIVRTTEEKTVEIPTLNILIQCKNVRQVAAELEFAEDEQEALEEALSAENAEEWKGVLSAKILNISEVFAIGKNGFVWPVQGYTYLSTYFGEADAIYGLPHRGVDIPAPAGTPVHAAAAGTVVASGWNDSYGNYVKIDHGGGVTTLYAHNTTLLVVYGQEVLSGDVISLVGSTGDSTGNHCHFEFAVNGNLQNPLDFVDPA